MTTVHLGADLAADPRRLPRCCVRHGAPARCWLPVTFVSRPGGWMYPLLLLGPLVSGIVLALTTRRLQVAAWPFCGRCLSLRRNRLTLVAAGCLTWAGLATALGLLLPEATDPELDPVAGLAGLALRVGFQAFAVTVAIALAVVGYGWGRLGTVACATVDPSGRTVRFRPAAFPFVSALPRQGEVVDRFVPVQAPPPSGPLPADAPYNPAGFHRLDPRFAPPPPGFESTPAYLHQRSRRRF